MTIVDPSFNYIQQPSLQYNKPVSESSLSALGSSINGLLSVLFPVGSIIDSMLTEVQFQAQIGNPSPSTWVLADGRSSAGSLYAEVTGQANIPDLRGIFRRGKNNGRSDSTGNQDGDLDLGTYTDDKFEAHTHDIQLGASGSPVGTRASNWWTQTDFGVQTSSSTGGNETAPRNVTVNTFIRIN